MVDNPFVALATLCFPFQGKKSCGEKAPSGGEKPARIGRRARLFSARSETAKLSASSSFLIERIKKQSPVLCFNRSSNLVLYSLWSIVTLSHTVMLLSKWDRMDISGRGFDKSTLLWLKRMSNVFLAEQ